MKLLAAGFPPYFEKNIFQSHWQLTQLCNFNCSYCVNKERRRDGLHMPEETMRHALQLISGLNASRFIFCLSGGEVTLYPWLSRMLAHISELFPSQAAINLMSNGSASAKRMRNLLYGYPNLCCRFVITIHETQTNLSKLIDKLLGFSVGERKKFFTVKLIVPPGILGGGANKQIRELEMAGIEFICQPVLDFCSGKLAPGYTDAEIEGFLHPQRKPWFQFRHLSKDRALDVSFTEGIIEDMFHYRGMYCAAGLQSVFLDEYGHVSRGQFCGRMPYTIMDKNPFEDPNFYNIHKCQEDHCACTPFTALPKWKSEKYAPSWLKNPDYNLIASNGCE